MRKILIILVGILLLVSCASAVTYTYVSQYPPVHNATYVKTTSEAAGGVAPGYLATDPTKSLTGSATGSTWQAVTGQITNQRFHIDLGTPIAIKRIYYENHHHYGGYTGFGSKNFTFWGSNTTDSFDNLTYANNTGWTQLTVDVSGFERHVAADVADPQYRYVTNNVPYRYYAFKISNSYGDGYLDIRRIELQSMSAWVYSTPGTYYWVCPDDVTNITLSIGGGGGSGKGGYTNGGYYYAGGGGSAGEHQSIARIEVTPGYNYTVVTGAGGANASYGAASNVGTYSSAFNYTKNGGVGGINLLTSSGGDGEIGFLDLSSKFALDGTRQGTSWVAGVGGMGYSAGGGGGTSDNVDQNTQGGKGADGIVRITQYGLAGINLPDFVADSTTVSAGSMVQFTDLSTIENSPVTYLWDWGDGTTSTTYGNANHVYSYTGSYDVSLTLTSSGYDTTEIKIGYISVVNIPTELDLQDKPQSVQFHVQNYLGTPLTGATVSIIGISTSTGDWDWVVTLLGLKLDEAPINATYMQQTSDSFGNAEFLMIPSVKYNVTTTLSGYSFSPLYVSPHEDVYPITANFNLTDGFGIQNPVTGKSNVSVVVSGTAINATYGRINLTFLDSASSTTGGNISVYRQNATPGGARILVATMPVSSSSFSNNTTIVALTGVTGTNFVVTTNVTSSLESSNIRRDSLVSFNGTPAAIGWLSSELTLLLAVFFILLTAMFAGRMSGVGMGIAVCAEAWIFYAMGWWNLLVNIYGATMILGAFTLATVAVIVWGIAEGWGGQT